MRPMNWKPALVIVIVTALFGAAANAQAQPPENPWSLDVGIGWDNGVSGHINSSGIGTINNQAVVILKKSYEDVYGTGLNLRFGGGYMFKEKTEVRVTFTFQSLDADFVVPLGDLGVSNLYGQYSDYQAFGMDVGLRQYGNLTEKIRAYGEGNIGLGFVDKIDLSLVAPTANLTREANDVYDQTAAFTAGANGGLLFRMAEKADVYVELGLRYVSGLSQIDDLVGTGLDNINDKSSRWTVPFMTGVRFRF